jgi:signal peptidase II
VGFVIPALVVIAVDQLTKQLAWHYFDIGRYFELIPGMLRITLVKNAGAAFGMFEGGRAFFIVASIIAAAVITYIGLRLPPAERLKRLLLGLILGGAIGNLIDRIYDGAVIDFVEMGIGGHWWPVYNVADIAVSVGAVLLLVQLLFFSPRAGEAPGERVETAGVTSKDTNSS